MANKYYPKSVTISGLPGWAGGFDAHLQSLSIGYGSSWGVAVVDFPASFAGQGSGGTGSSVTITVGSDTIMRGHVVRVPNMIDAGIDIATVVIADLRWDMARRKVGQYGIGNFHPTAGGFRGVGLKVHFNPKGIGNRSDSKSGSAYDFLTGPDAQMWTREDILEFLLAWYYPAMTIGNLSSAWSDTEPDFYAYLKPLPNALTQLAARAGESWAPIYDGGGIYFGPIGQNPGTYVSLSLPDATSGGTASASSEKSVQGAIVEQSILDSIDRLEIHTANQWVETTYSNTGESPLLEGFETSLDGYIYGFKVDVTNYAAHNLGANLPAGSKPKKWISRSVTRLNDIGDAYITAGSLSLFYDVGKVMRPEYCIWANMDGEDTKKRVKSGIQLILDDGIILIQNTVNFYDGTFVTNWVPEYAEQMKLWFTVTTEIEVPYVYYNTPGSYHINSSSPIVECIQRADLRPMKRYNVTLPTLDPKNAPDTTYTVAASEEWYVDYRDMAIDIFTGYYDARNRAEVFADIRLLDIPSVQLGNGLSVGPANLGLSGNEVIVGLSYRAADDDYVRIRATNNIARLIAGDV